MSRHVVAHVIPRARLLPPPLFPPVPTVVCKDITTVSLQLSRRLTKQGPPHSPTKRPGRQGQGTAVRSAKRRRHRDRHRHRHHRHHRHRPVRPRAATARSGRNSRQRRRAPAEATTATALRSPSGRLGAPQHPSGRLSRPRCPARPPLRRICRMIARFASPSTGCVPSFVASLSATPPFLPAAHQVPASIGVCQCVRVRVFT